MKRDTNLRGLSLLAAALVSLNTGCGGEMQAAATDTGSASIEAGLTAVWKPLIACEGGRVILDLESTERRRLQLVIRDVQLMEQLHGAGFIDPKFGATEHIIQGSHQELRQQSPTETWPANLAAITSATEFKKMLADGAGHGVGTFPQVEDRGAELALGLLRSYAWNECPDGEYWPDCPGMIYHRTHSYLREYLFRNCQELSDPTHMQGGANMSTRVIPRSSNHGGVGGVYAPQYGQVNIHANVVEKDVAGLSGPGVITGVDAFIPAAAGSDWRKVPLNFSGRTTASVTDPFDSFVGTANVTPEEGELAVQHGVALLAHTSSGEDVWMQYPGDNAPVRRYGT